ncbi:FtsX-like permease family protein [Litorilituus lipolyticus]|uniref:FtsX-like permease family protein n=1 Tax=Litorilituus lipolyticus TaxID=2491017 RepID=A0A502KLL8_9GAMM|nr:FtsX-like permease family protein [Litorilituus lipolyticus]TPH12144.1 FtsX-like permease family protein [Litorilituus lipolyticus]
MSLMKKSLYQGIVRIFSIPRLSIPLILTLGLTLGAVLTVIAIASTFLHQPLQGVKEEAHLQTYEYRFQMSDTLSVSYWNMNRLIAFSEQFKDLGEWAAIAPAEQDIEINNITYTTTRYDASSNITSVLGSQLLLGDDVTIEAPEKYIWISNSLWQQAYGGQKSVLGKQISIANQNYIIAGVIEDVMAVKSGPAILPQQVWFIANLAQVKQQQDSVGAIRNEIDFLILKSPNGQAILPTKEQTDAWLTDYVSQNVSGDQVQMFLDFLSNTKKVVKASDYRSNLLGESEGLIVALFAAVTGLLLMATLNLLNLFIAHYQSRTKEFAIQISLGASLNKVRTLVLLENLPSFILAAITGLLVTGWALRSLPLIAGDSLPMIDAITINGLTILASVLIIFLLSVLFSALAIVDIDKHALANNLNSSGKGIQAQSNQWLSRVLMIFQLSIASILLTASVMVAMQSYQAVYQELGYDIGNSYNISLSVSDDEYITQLNDFEDYGKSETKQLLNNLSALIEKQVANSEVVVADYGPLSGSLQVSAFRNNENGGQRVVHQVRSLSANFFTTFNIEMLAGANLTQAQIDNNENRVVIDASMAKTLFPALSYQEVIGKTFQTSQDPEAPATIINGIVADTISQTGIAEPLGLPAVYSHRIRVGGNIQLTVMMPEGKNITPEMIDSELKRQHPRLTNLQVQSLHDIWLTQTLNQRVSLWVVLTMTALTLFLAAIGVAGLTQMTTNHRKYELAVRMATGAKQSRLVKFILKDALIMLALGLGLGFIFSVFAYQHMEQTLEMLPNFNWLAMTLLDVALIIIVLISVILPAWRVIRSDPMQALREE